MSKYTPKEAHNRSTKMVSWTLVIGAGAVILAFVYVHWIAGIVVGGIAWLFYDSAVRASAITLDRLSPNQPDNSNQEIADSVDLNDPNISKLCKNFETHINEAYAETEKWGTNHPDIPSETAWKIIEHIVNKIEGEELSAKGKHYYAAVLHRFIESLPDDWSMGTLLLIYISSFQSVLEGKPLHEWIEANERKINTGMKNMRMLDQIHLPMNAYGSLNDSLPHNLKLSVKKIFLNHLSIVL